MEIVLPSDQQVEMINASREGAVLNMTSEEVDRRFRIIAGVCAVDLNGYPDGTLAAERHAENIHEHIATVDGIEDDERFNGAKPRTDDAPFTGILHVPGGARTYTEAASRLTDAGVSLAAEIMDESDVAIAGPWLTTIWMGARNIDDTGVRYLGRPTNIDLERGIRPAPIFVKNGQNGFGSVAPAIRTLINPHEVTRTRLTLNGLEEVSTYGNDMVGVILRGQRPRPEGPIAQIIHDEVVAVRAILAHEFPDRRIPVYIDISHDHAKMEGGGEKGQLRVAEAIAYLLHKEGLDIDGMLMESYRYPGNQPRDGKKVGLSVVDPCVGEDTAYKIIEMMSDAWLTRKVA